MQGSDTGAIDSGARWINRGTVVRHNLFFSIGNHADGACNSNFQCELPTFPIAVAFSHHASSVRRRQLHMVSAGLWLQSD